ncbi:leucine-rich repeat-containing protein 38 [Rhinichthys klamathensis goyatoka]|uniref:leucine-rich repeat-containing protein 38 n=1 Tax=Rhinichthys klamathensis goyatoka TaxID=3034132 RepID=UPI0024B5E4B6|nr:leucine-rich repeat-containing protein 38 [Rhinichthys klamathensis goyatoka]
MCIGTQILLVLLVHAVSSIPSGCPERCVCDDQHVVQCAEQDLCRFPTGLPLTTRQLILSNNRISDLPALELNFLSDLMYLDCSNNSLTHISESTFANLRKLAYLDLSFNSLGKIEEQTFRALESLVMLRLTDNPRLSEFHPQAFPHASGIQVLDISRNNLSRLNVSSLMALGGLRSLGLSGNPWLCGCDTEELCLWMHTDTVKFQEATLECLAPFGVAQMIIPGPLNLPVIDTEAIPESSALLVRANKESVPEFVPSAHEDASEFNYAAPMGLPESSPVALEGPPKPTFVAPEGIPMSVPETFTFPASAVMAPEFKSFSSQKLVPELAPSPRVTHVGYVSQARGGALPTSKFGPSSIPLAGTGG